MGVTGRAFVLKAHEATRQKSPLILGEGSAHETAGVKRSLLVHLEYMQGAGPSLGGFSGRVGVAARFTASSQYSPLFRFSFQPVAEYCSQDLAQRQFCCDLRSAETGRVLRQGRGCILKKQLNDLGMLGGVCGIDRRRITGARIDALRSGGAGDDAEEPGGSRTKLHRKVP